MTRKDAYINYLRAINKFDAVDRPTTSEAEVWLNRGMDKFIKTRYSGNNQKLEGFEQSQKRIEDLRGLLEVKRIELIKNGKKQLGTIPSGLMIFIGDSCSIVPSADANSCNCDDKVAKCWDTEEDEDGVKRWVPKMTEVTDVTHDTLAGNLNNSLAPQVLMFGQARPLRLMAGNTIELYSDGSYMVSDYSIKYIKYPKPISLYIPRDKSLCELSSQTHPEIVQMAADLYLAATASPTVQLQMGIENTIE